MGLFLHDFHRWLVLWIVRLKSLTILESLVKKPLVSVFAPLRPFSTQISQELNVPISAHQSTSKLLVMKSSFLHFKVFGYEVRFSALQSFCSKVHTTPHRWSSPYDAPMKVYDFCTTLVHCPERVTHYVTQIVLCSCQSWSRHHF